MGLAEYRETLSDPSFVAIIVSRIIGASAAGTITVRASPYRGKVVARAPGPKPYPGGLW